MKGLEDLKRVVTGGRSVTAQEVMEQRRDAGKSALDGQTFDLVALKWRDITAFFLDGKPNTKRGREELAGRKSKTIEFMQFGLKVHEDKDDVVIMHSFSLKPNRAEFFRIPKSVVMEEKVVGRIKIVGDKFKVM